MKIKLINGDNEASRAVLKYINKHNWDGKRARKYLKKYYNVDILYTRFDCYIAVFANGDRSIIGVLPGLNHHGRKFRKAIKRNRKSPSIITRNKRYYSEDVLKEAMKNIDKVLPKTEFVGEVEHPNNKEDK